MSDVEEPPTKVSKYEMSQTYTQPDEMDDDGQEEWLSEEILTDEDATADENHTEWADDVADDSQDRLTDDSHNKSMEENGIIEQTLDSLDSQKQKSLQDTIKQFLTKKPNTKKVQQEPEQLESDGNDTDDLLRMLEDDDRVKKTKMTMGDRSRQSKIVTRHSSEDEDDDDFDLLKGATVTQLKVAQSVLMRKAPARKAVPEEFSDDSDDDETTNESETVQHMFGVKKRGHYASKSTTKPPLKTVRITNSTGLRKIVEKTSTPRQYSRKPQKKPTPNLNGPVTITKLPAKPADPTNMPRLVTKIRDAGGKPKLKLVEKPKVVEKSRSLLKNKVLSISSLGEDHEEVKEEDIIKDEDFLEDDDFELDEDFAMESDTELDRNEDKQRIMRPEQMDEEMISDGDSHSEVDSLYDNLPTSDSEDDYDDWFTLDIRDERASDYIPLLGPKAYDLLLDEKRRVHGRIRALRRSVSLLTQSGRRQATRLAAANRALSHVNDLIKAA